MRKSNKLKILLFTLLLGLLLIPYTASAMDTEDCLACHNDPEEVGDDFHIDATKFSHTVHSEMGCVTCHESVTDDHPDDGKVVSKAACLDCHEEISEQYAASPHAENAVCSDCHNPHEARGIDAMSGPDMNRQCAKCHENSDILASHSKWLPQASLHITKVPCITCHTSAKGYEVVLNVTQKQSKEEGLKGYRFSTYADLKQYSGDKDIQSLIDLNEDGHISLAELRTFNRNPAYKNLHLSGTLIPSEVSHDLTTLDNRYDCTYCHAAGPGSMQTSFLALPTEDGTYRRMTVETGAILDTLYGTPNFYMTGSTRSATMNIIGLIIICGGFIMPIGHGTLRFLTRKNRKH